MGDVWTECFLQLSCWWLCYCSNHKRSAGKSEWQRVSDIKNPEHKRALSSSSPCATQYPTTEYPTLICNPKQFSLTKDLHRCCSMFVFFFLIKRLLHFWEEKTPTKQQRTKQAPGQDFLFPAKLKWTNFSFPH